MTNDPHAPPGVDPGRSNSSHSGLDIIPESIEILNDNLTLNSHLPGLVKGEPTALLLDINNLFRRVDENGWRIDYGKLKYIFKQRCDLRYCAAFSAIDRTDFTSMQWAEYMTKNDYVLHSKDLKRYRSQDGEQVAKGNMDIEIALDAMDLSAGFSHVIIGSCDGDFVPLVERLKKGNLRKVSILGLSGRNRTGISKLLIEAADNFYDMSMFRDHVVYVKKKSAHHDR